jgi:hypothetical protein
MYGYNYITLYSIHLYVNVQYMCPYIDRTSFNHKSKHIIDKPLLDSLYCQTTYRYLSDDNF